MATINATNPTLFDLAKMKDPDGKIARVVEMLTQNNPMLEDITFQESNGITGHVVTSRTSLPAIAWRGFNEGVARSKGTTGQATETCGLLSGQSSVDVKLAELNGGAEFRKKQDDAFIQAFNNELESGLLYHSTKTDVRKFMGFSPRFDSTTGAAGNQILLHDGGAAGADQTSIWLVGYSPTTVYGIVPKGSTVGLDMKDMGEQLVEDSAGSGKFYRGFVTDFNWSVGLCIEDWRYVVRIANVDTSALVGTGMLLITSMIRAIEEKMYSLAGVRPVFYVNRKIASFLRQQAVDSTKSSTLSIERIEGKPILMFNGIPVRRTDALLNTEAVVS